MPPRPPARPSARPPAVKSRKPLLVLFVAIAILGGAAGLVYEPVDAGGYMQIMAGPTGDHRGAALNGATTRGQTYVWVEKVRSGSIVKFWIDDPNHQGEPMRVDYTVFYDLVGTAGGAALPFDTHWLADGQHTITARITYRNQKATWRTATFTVANDTGGAESSTTAPPTTAAPTTATTAAPTTATTAAPTTTTAAPTTTTAVPTTTTAAPPAPPPSGAFTVGSGVSAMTFPEKPGLTVPESSLTPYSGPSTISSGTWSFSNCLVTSQVRVNAGANVTFTNCKFVVNVEDAGYGMLGKAGVINCIHCLFDATAFNGVTFAVIVEGGGLIRYSEFVSMTDNIRLGSRATVEWNYIHAPQTSGATGAHSDGIEVYYGARPAGWVGPHIFVRNNYIDIRGAVGENSSLNITNDFGSVDGVRVEGNTFMPGGGFSLYMRGDGYCGCGGKLQNIEVVGNRWFSDSGHRYGGYYGTRSYEASRDGNVTAWSGNTFTGLNGLTIPLSIDNYQPST